MKKSVVDINDLQEAAPFFKSRIGTFLGKLLIKWLSVDKVNKVHANNCHLRGSAFTTALLRTTSGHNVNQYNAVDRTDRMIGYGYKCPFGQVIQYFRMMQIILDIDQGIAQ